MELHFIRLYGKDLRVLSVQNITNIIQSQSFDMQAMYEEAMLATISHEQMNPLNSIINFTDYLKTQTMDYLCIDKLNSSMSLSSEKSSS